MPNAKPTPSRSRVTASEVGTALTSWAFATAGRAPGTPRFRHVCFPARWPSRQAMQRARDRVRELTARDRLRWPVEQIVGNVNQFLRGWAGYFRYGNSTIQFEQIMRHADNRLALLIAKRNQ
jgi:hypothetical protein